MRVDFYVLQPPGDLARRRVACRVAEKAWHAGLSVLLNVDSADEAALMDTLLWTFRDISFVPHARLGDNPVLALPVLIGCNTAPQPDMPSMLVNLAQDVPEFAGRFERIAEVVGGDEAALASGRLRYRAYAGMQAELTSHTVSRP